MVTSCLVVLIFVGDISFCAVTKMTLDSVSDYSLVWTVKLGFGSKLTPSLRLYSCPILFGPLYSSVRSKLDPSILTDT